MAEVLFFPKPQSARDGRRTRHETLTELRVQKLPAHGATYYVNDAKQPGLSIRVSARGVKAFVFTKFKDGRLTRITLGRAGAMRLDDARRAAAKLHGEMALGIDVRATKKAANAPAKAATMQKAFERFLELKERRRRTVADYQTIWRLHVPSSLKRKAVGDVTSEDVENAKRVLGSRYRTANKVIVLLASIFSKSGRWADNPARHVERYREHVRTRRLSADELVRVWRAIEGERDWGDFFRVLILTGARRTPFCAMRWRDLDLDVGVWTVPAEWAKSKREMAIPLSSDAVRILRDRRGRQPAGLEWVWPSQDSTTGHAVNPEKPWRRVLKAAGVAEHATLHDIRRTLGSRLAMDGVAGTTISKVLGHVSPQSLKAYAHLDVTAGREAIERAMAGITSARAANTSGDH